MNSGAYQLIINIKKEIKVKIGSLGQCRFPAGKYVYTGSAMRGLEKRVQRHQRKDKKQHWHIDFLLADDNVEIIDIKKFPSKKKIECELNGELLNRQNSEVPVKGFGSSDCRECPAHLIRLTNVSP